jgi:hypothetical protein
MAQNFKSPADVVDWLVRGVRKLGLEQMFGRYYGTYRAIVEDVVDPEGRGRVRLKIPVLGQVKASPDLWAVPVWPGASGGHGIFFSPVVGDVVWVQFESGDPNRPLLVGGMTAKAKMPAELASPEALRRGIRTPGGHWIRFSDDPADLHLTISTAGGGYASMDKDGNVIVSNKNGSHLYLNAKDGQTTVMDETGSMVSMVDGKISLVAKDGSAISISDKVQVLAKGDVVLTAGGKVSIKAGSVDVGDAATQQAVLGTAMLALYNSHTHVGNLGAPTSPPVAPMVPGTHTSLSVRVK